MKLEFSAKFPWLGEERNRMKASKFTEARKAFIVKQGEQGTPVVEICRKAGFSQATYFSWKRKYGGLLPEEMRRLKALEGENTRLLPAFRGPKLGSRATVGKFQLEEVQGWVAEHWLGGHYTTLGKS